MLCSVALSWILFHEESHFISGHFHSMSAGRRQSGHARLENLDQTQDKLQTAEERELRKVLEWHADRSATHTIVDIFMDSVFLSMLPSYCKRDMAWVLRMIMTAVGTAILAIDRARQVSGTSANYPDPLARLASVFVACAGRILDTDRFAAMLGLKLHTTDDSVRSLLTLIMWFWQSFRDVMVCGEIFENENTEGTHSGYVDPFPADERVAIPVFVKIFEAVSMVPEVLSLFRQRAFNDASSSGERVLTLEHGELARKFDATVGPQLSPFIEQIRIEGIRKREERRRGKT